VEGELAIVALFSVASIVAIATRWLRVPYTIALVVAGLVLGNTEALSAPQLTKELLFALFLPGLVFEAAFHLDFELFWANKYSIHGLAIPGLVAAIFLTAAVLVPVVAGLGFEHDFTFLHGLLFAALIAATDPIAVVALFKSLGVPKRLNVLIEGESLINDGAGVVLFTLVLATVSGTEVTFADAVLEFVAVAGLGGLVGASIGYAVSKVIQQVDDPMIEITLTTIAAYGSFAVAEHFHWSGVIATVVAGMLCGNYAARTGMSPSTRVATETFWEYLAFALNSFVFLLIGFEVEVGDLLDQWQPIVVAWLVVTAGRAVVTYAVAAIMRRTPERVPWRWAGVMAWGGLRGGLSMVLVLALPRDLPHREFLVTLTFGVVLLSILIQGLSMGSLLRRLGLVGKSASSLRYEAARASMQAANAALARLAGLQGDGDLHADDLAALRAQYEARRDEAAEHMRVLHLETATFREERLLSTARALILSEKESLLDALRRGELGGETFEHLVADVDARLIELGAGGHATSAASSDGRHSGASTPGR